MSSRKSVTDKRLFRFLINGMAEGIAAGWILLLVLLWTDTAGLGTLVDKSNHSELAVFMLGWMFAITFGSAGMGFAMLRMSEETENDGLNED